MKIFITTLILGILVIVGFVYIMDPAYRWRDAPTPFYRNLNSDEARIFPDNFDERTIKVSHIHFIEKPDLVLFGSSRMAPIDSSLFNKNIKVFNAGVSSASIEDFIALWQVLKDEGKIPNGVIIFIDPWLFNSSAVAGASGWKNISKFITEFNLEKGFQEKQNFSENKKILSIQEKIQRFFEKLKAQPVRIKRAFDDKMEMPSWPMVKAAFSLLFRNGHSPDRLRNFIVKKSDLRNQDKAVLSDGATVYPSSDLNPKTVETLDSLAKKFVSSPNDFDPWHFDQDALKRFKMLVSDFQSRNVSVFLISLPFHPLMAKLMIQDLGYIIFSEPQDALDTLSQTHNCNAENFRKVGCEETEMKDSIHPLVSCIKKALNYCALTDKSFEGLF